MDTTANNGIKAQHEILRMDLSNATYRDLAKCAGRIATLLESQKARTDHALVGSLDDFLGVIYALIYAKKSGFRDRPGCPIEKSAVANRAKDLAKGTVRTDGAWMAGFHFNSALFRISAVYHRLLKIVVGTKRGYVPALSPKAKELYHGWKKQNWSNRNVHGVYIQVNNLKHEPEGTYGGRQVEAGYQNAVSAVAELLDLVEVWAASPTT